MEPTFTNVAILVGVFAFGYFFNDLLSRLMDSKPMTKEQYDQAQKEFEEASIAYANKFKEKK